MFTNNCCGNFLLQKHICYFHELRMSGHFNVREKNHSVSKIKRYFLFEGGEACYCLNKCSTSTTFSKIQELKWSIVTTWSDSWEDSVCRVSFMPLHVQISCMEAVIWCEQIMILCLVPFSCSATHLSDLKLAVQQGWRRTLWCKVVWRSVAISSGQKKLLLSRTLEDFFKKTSLLSLHHHHPSSALWFLLSFPFCVDLCVVFLPIIFLMTLIIQQIKCFCCFSYCGPLLNCWKKLPVKNDLVKHLFKRKNVDFSLGVVIICLLACKPTCTFEQLTKVLSKQHNILHHGFFVLTASFHWQFCMSVY